MMKRFAILLAAALALAGCGEPESIEKVSSVIKSASEVDGRLKLRLHAPSLDGGEKDMASIAHAIFNSAEWQMTHGGGIGDGGMHFFVYIPIVTDHGETGLVGGMIIELAASDLRRIHWENVQHWSVMNLTTVREVDEFGRKLGAAWCADSDNLRYSPHFCAQVLAS